MGIVKVLKRKDGAALVVGVTLGLFVFNLASGLTVQLTQKISNLGSNTVTTTAGWRGAYLQPIVSFLLELLVLEVVIRLYVALHDYMSAR
ncbi:MAG: hypothetical protein ACXWLH_02835 [Candidatus Saccharimonadales bacterium]